MGTCWCFGTIQQTNRRYLSTLHPQLWSDYLDYLLGETVFGMVSRVGGVAVSGSVSESGLSHEYEIRAAAYKRVMKGEDVAVALRTSWMDPVVKERFFTTPLSWEAIETAKRRPDSQQEYPAKASRMGSYDNSKGKGKGKMTKGEGKGKESKSKVEECAEGNRICFTFNNTNQKCTMGKNCRFLHVCRRCEVAKLPMYECKCPPDTLQPRLTQLQEVVSKKQAKERMRSLSLLPKVLVRKVSEFCVSSLGEESAAALAAICTRSSRGWFGCTC